MSELLSLSLGDLAARVRSGDVSPLATIHEALEAIEALDPRLNACCQVRPEASIAAARRLAERATAGDDPGPLAGIPLGVKDLEDARGWRTTCGDPAHGDDPPATRDSIEVERLVAAGCVVVAKTNTAAYGFHAETDNLLFGPTRNPWAESRTAGGSSGGTAAAVSARMFPLGTGSDGGGSIRIPSAACGVAGFKPTHGLVPTGDVAPPVWGPLSTRGPMAATFADTALALDTLRGSTPRDPLSVELADSFVDAVAAPRLEGARLAWCTTPGTFEPDPRIVEVCERALGELGAAGATVEPVESVFPEPPLRAWTARAAAGAWMRLGPDRDAWEGRFLHEVTELAAAGEHTTAADLVAAEDATYRAVHALAELFEHFDVLATPASGGAPPRVRERHPLGAGWAGNFTLPFNVTRSPAAVVPAGFVVDDGDRLPVALQLVGPRLSDTRLMSIAAAAEAVLDVTGERPPTRVDA